MDQKKSFFKRFWWMGLLIIVAFVVIIVFALNSNSQKDETSLNDAVNLSENNQNNNEQPTDIRYPSDVIDCPADLSGILDYPFMPPEAILFLTPLGNINPPGHVIPIDHIYFQSLAEGQIPLYAPANAKIINDRRVGEIGDRRVHSHRIFNISSYLQRIGFGSDDLYRDISKAAK
ncbi:MAG: hypothetical protein WC528_03440 [Patescibacteria group bacterium]